MNKKYLLLLICLLYRRKHFDWASILLPVAYWACRCCTCYAFPGVSCLFFFSRPLLCPINHTCLTQAYLVFFTGIPNTACLCLLSFTQARTDVCQQASVEMLWWRIRDRPSTPEVLYPTLDPTTDLSQLPPKLQVCHSSWLTRGDFKPWTLLIG